MASLKGTRKTYSFEERKILLSLINKYAIIQDKKSDSISTCKRKSAWAKITEEYNSLVGSRATRSAIQLKRCWENMKACKRNREEKKFRDNMKAICQLTKDEKWPKGQDISSQKSEVPMSTGIVGLPPNVVFEPKDSEPFTLQGVSAAGSQSPNCLNEGVDSRETSNSSDAFRQMIVNRIKYNDIAPFPDEMNDFCEKFVKKNADPSTIGQPTDNNVEKIARREVHAKPGPSDLYPSISPCVPQEQHNSNKKSMREEEKLHVLALSEAQMKVDIAAILKEEATIKLEEAHYRKEEARLKMLFFTYKLDKIKDQ